MEGHVPQEPAKTPEERIEALEQQISAMREDMNERFASLEQLIQDKLSSLGTTATAAAVNPETGPERSPEAPAEEEEPVVILRSRDNTEEEPTLVRPAATDRSTSRTENEKPGFFERNKRKALALGAAALLAVGVTAIAKNGGESHPASAQTNNEQNDNGANGDNGSDSAKDRTAKFEKVMETKSIPAAVLALKSNDSNIHRNLKAIANGRMDENGYKKIVHNYGGHEDMMNSVLPKFSPEEVTANDGAEAVMMGIEYNDANAAANYNDLKGNRISENLPSGVSLDEARAELTREIAGEGASYRITSLDGSWMNHGANGNDVYEAGVIQNPSRVLEITTVSGEKLYYKIFENGCINNLTPVEGKESQPRTPQGDDKNPPRGDTPDEPEGKDEPNDKPEKKNPREPEAQDEPSEAPDKDPSEQPVSEGGPGAGGSPEEGMDPENDSDETGYGPGDTVPAPDPHPNPPAPEVPATEQPTPTEEVPAPAPPTPPAPTGGPEQPTD